MINIDGIQFCFASISFAGLSFLHSTTLALFCVEQCCYLDVWSGEVCHVAGLIAICDFSSIMVKWDVYGWVKAALSEICDFSSMRSEMWHLVRLRLY